MIAGQKARENKERTERDMRNREHAGNCYRSAAAELDFSMDDSMAGLPWGGMNFGVVMAKAQEVESRRSSGHGTYTGDGSVHSGGNYNLSYGQSVPTGSYGGSAMGNNMSEDMYMTRPQYMYEPPPVTAYNMIR